MLILSRRSNESISFPQLGISVAIVSVRGSRVHVGIKAPAEIQVLRSELARTDGAAAEAPSESEASRKQRHEFKNQLNRATLGLQLAQRQLRAGQTEAADKTLRNALTKLSELESSVASAKAQTQSIQSTAQSTAQSIEQNKAQDQRPAAASDQQQGNSKGTSAGMEVLLVEDDQNEQALLRCVLEMEGFRVHSASNGYEALAVLETTNPQFILLDMNMPECDGRQTCTSIRQLPHLEKLPIYAVSGSSPHSMGLNIGEGGVDDWFPKPLNATTLVQRLKQHASAIGG